jgi:hypothetical protein
MYALLIASFWLGACGDGKPPTPPMAHRHESLQGGTAVELGPHEFHLDVVHDPAAGTLRAYVMDGHMENFIRVRGESFEISAALPSGTTVLLLKAVANSATGEKVGDTSLFETREEALKNVAGFNAVLKQITIRGRNYANVAFRVGKTTGVGTAKSE